ncbi:MAG: hypothetical protein U1E65_20440 [Myxococcota bacterium]
MEALFALPPIAGSPTPDGFREETSVYRVTPRPKPKFHTVIDPRRVFGETPGTYTVTTRVRDAGHGETALELVSMLKAGTLEVEDRFDCVWRGGLHPGKLSRTIGGARQEHADFVESPYPFPPATYPDVLIPFLMRGQPRDGQRRTLCAWTSDRFIARVYYESRDRKTLHVPLGHIAATEVWMYPDLNDWVSLGSVLTKLAKPLLPRYEMWFEDALPHRVVRFEGSYGPPGAPEVLLELMR